LALASHKKSCDHLLLSHVDTNHHRLLQNTTHQAKVK